MASARRNPLKPLVLAMALSVALGFGMARGLQATDDLRTQLDLFSQILYLVQNNYVDAPDNEKLIKGAIDGMLKTLDPHTVYVPEQRAQRMDEEFQGEYSGIGIQFEIRDNAIVVISPLEGTPAYRLGLTAGDRITEVDDVPLPKGLTNDDVFKLLRGPHGSMVGVTIQRQDVPEALKFSIERAKIPIESVPYAFMIRPGIGYVRIIRFSQTTGDELETALNDLTEQGMKSLLLDLRSNSGGLLSQAIEVLDQLVPENRLLVYTRGRIPSANADYRSGGREKFLEGPIVALIDHGSASASEIVSGAIQDLDRGLVAGTNSFGKGLVQNQLRLSDGSKLLLTIAKYYTPSGRLIQRDYTKFSDRGEYQEEAYKNDVPSDSVLATMPQHKTAGGRTVFGGGGIYPDVIIKDDPNLTVPQAQMIQNRVFWEFATQYVHARKGEKWTTERIGRDFKMADADWNTLRTIMTARKVTVSDSVFTADREFMVRQIRSEIAQNTMGSTERYRVLIEDDTQLNESLELFPRASRLMSGNFDDTEAGRRLPSRTPPATSSTSRDKR
jgi:carboxyl-terminal processing protease